MYKNHPVNWVIFHYKYYIMGFILFKTSKGSLLRMSTSLSLWALETTSSDIDTVVGKTISFTTSSTYTIAKVTPRTGLLVSQVDHFEIYADDKSTKIMEVDSDGLGNSVKINLQDVIEYYSLTAPNNGSAEHTITGRAVSTFGTYTEWGSVEFTQQGEIEDTVVYAEPGRNINGVIYLTSEFNLLYDQIDHWNLQIGDKIITTDNWTDYKTKNVIYTDENIIKSFNLTAPNDTTEDYTLTFWATSIYGGESHKAEQTITVTGATTDYIENGEINITDAADEWGKYLLVYGDVMNHRDQIDHYEYGFDNPKTTITTFTTTSTSPSLYWEDMGKTFSIDDLVNPPNNTVQDYTIKIRAVSIFGTYSKWGSLTSKRYGETVAEPLSYNITITYETNPKGQTVDLYWDTDIEDATIEASLDWKYKIDSRDFITGYQRRTDTGDFVGGPFNVVSVGSHTIELVGIDTDGNETSKTITIEMPEYVEPHVDFEISKLAITDGILNISLDSTPENETITYTIKIDGIVNTSGYSKTTYTIPELDYGEHTIEVTATCQHENVSTKSIVYTLEEPHRDFTVSINPYSDGDTEITWSID